MIYLFSASNPKEVVSRSTFENVNQYCEVFPLFEPLEVEKDIFELKDAIHNSIYFYASEDSRALEKFRKRLLIEDL